MKRIILPKPAFYILASLALAGPLLFQAASSFVALLWMGYNPVKDAISMLVFSPYGWVQTLVFYLFGLSILALAAILFFKVRVKFNAGAILMAALGVCFVLIGINATQAPGEPLTLSAVVHRIATACVLMLFPMACFLLAPSLKAWGYRGLCNYSVAVGVFSTVFVLLGGAILVLQYNLVGLYERVMLWNGQVWLSVVCGNLLITDIRRRLALVVRQRAIRSPAAIVSGIIRSPAVQVSRNVAKRYWPAVFLLGIWYVSARRTLAREPVKTDANIILKRRSD